MSDFGLKDSGERRDFDTGSRRDVDTNKSRPDLISPFMLIRVGDHLAKGAKKYGERNWEKGQPVTVLIASAFRHLTLYMIGKRDEDHLAAIIFNIGAIIHFEECARYGDEVALRMLDAYASQDLRDEILGESAFTLSPEEARDIELSRRVVRPKNDFLDTVGNRT